MAGAGMIAVEIPVHIFKSPVVGTVLGTAVETIVMSLAMGPIHFAMDSPARAVVTSVLIIGLLAVVTSATGHMFRFRARTQALRRP